jgi:phosphotransferase system  glucose/maltose/N-acetylglucosamine-specific IIC component
MTLDPQTLKIINAIKSNIVIPLIYLMFAIALVYFFWGGVEYIISLNNPTKKKEGQDHLFWGVIGLVIMISVFGITTFIFNTVTDNNNIKGIGGGDIVQPSIIKNQQL